MKVFVLGATGYIGSAVAGALARAGHAVTGLARSPAKAEALRAAGYSAVVGDIDAPQGFAAAAAAHDTILHVAAVTGEGRAARDRAVTLALVDAARATGQPRHVIYTSGTYSLGDTGGVAAGEDWPATRPAARSRERVLLEREVLAAAGGDLVTTVVRPADVYGGREGVVSWLARWLPEAAGRKGIVHVGEGTNRWPVVALADLARLYALLVERRVGGMLHAAEEEAVPVVEIAAALARASGLAVSIWAPEEAAGPLGDMVEALLLDQIMASPRSLALLGWRAEGRFLHDAAQAWAELASDS
jgi:nucleoside-diphosphate-sugar epimerase